MTIGSDGLPVIAVGTATTGDSDLRLVHCADVRCQGTKTFRTLDTAGDTGRFPSITIGPDGRPLIAHRVTGAGDLLVTHCADETCRTATTVAVDTFGATGVRPSITIGADGRPLISYQNAGALLDLKVARCTNPFCVPHFRRR